MIILMYVDSAAGGQFLGAIILAVFALALLLWPITIYAKRLKALKRLNVSGLNDEGKESCRLYCSRMRWFLVGVPLMFAPIINIVAAFLILVGGIFGPIYFFKARRLGARLGITNKGVFKGVANFKPEWFAEKV